IPHKDFVRDIEITDRAEKNYSLFSGMILDYSPGSRFAFANGINHSHWTARDREAFTASRDDPGEVFMEATGEGEIDA
ncbi:MAG TPA: hypothetical protein VMD77_12955, partial [Candidatus Baltobacteraceae bacterium]|nr:hypothetical protein [Candidatus Baltobacteraceae bacterium]